MSQKSGKKTPLLEEKEKAKSEGPKDLKKKAAAKSATPEKQSAASASPSKEAPSPAQEKKSSETQSKVDNKVENESPSKSGKPKTAPKANDKSETNESKEQDKKETNANIQKQTASKSESPVGNSVNKDVHATEKSKMNGNSAAESIEIEDDDEILLVNTDHENDEHFPELSYEDNSDNENFEPSSTPEFTTSNRSMTRRSQVKNVRTPETPNPGPSKSTDKTETKETSVLPINGRDEKQQSAKDGEPASDVQSKDKILKMKDEHTPMKLRSSNTPTPDQKPEEEKPMKLRSGNTPTLDQKPEGEKQSEQTKDDIQSGEDSKNGHGGKKSEGGGGKIDTNFSKSRIKISPYRRSHRNAEQYSIIANYTGNNTTIDTDLTLDATASTSSTIHQESQNNASGLEDLRGIRGRSSYRQLSEMSARSASVVNRARLAGVVTSPPKPAPTPIRHTPIGHVVGRKRRQTDDDANDSSDERIETTRSWRTQPAVKRSRLVERVVSPFTSLVNRGRSFVASSTPLPSRRITPVVGVNSDLVSADIVPKPSAINASELKTGKPVVNIQVTTAPVEPISVDGNNGDKQRCVIM